LKIYIGPGYRLKDTEIIVKELGVGVMANAFLMRRSYAHRSHLRRFKIDNPEVPFALDNGAYQTWKYKEPMIPADLLLHFAKWLQCDLIIAQDVIGNVEETRRHHKIWSQWLKEYPLAAVLQGATVSRFEMEKDVDYYKSLGYTRFAFPAVAGELTHIARARVLTPYLHGLGFGKLVPKWARAFDSIDIGLWQARESPYIPYTLERAIDFIKRLQTI